MAVEDRDAAALRECPDVAPLIWLRKAGWRFPPLSQDGGVFGYRLWPEEWADSIRVRSATDCLAIRINPVGAVVWERAGSLADVVEGLLGLPSPDAPGAPCLVRGSAPDRW
ncbi:hypothetical protein UK23_28250 [Lentzea aerocolonigenes]|uniref:Uncharacterized protein n=2 Tax=Lentzea aerocolonigenes TaxID=68170 RepID=A0A0F0GQD0_LENAE|nr:hypothetical protein UK23_28250 [Lentzea aerocolonigenes]